MLEELAIAPPAAHVAFLPTHVAQLLMQITEGLGDLRDGGCQVVTLVLRQLRVWLSHW
jgi:hypothetical protein